MSDKKEEKIEKEKDLNIKNDPIWKLPEVGVFLGGGYISKNIDSIIYRNSK